MCVPSWCIVTGQCKHLTGRAGVPLYSRLYSHQIHCFYYYHHYHLLQPLRDVGMACSSPRVVCISPRIEMHQTADAPKLHWLPSSWTDECAVVMMVMMMMMMMMIEGQHHCSSSNASGHHMDQSSQASRSRWAGKLDGYSGFQIARYGRDRQPWALEPWGLLLRTYTKYVQGPAGGPGGPVCCAH